MPLISHTALEQFIHETDTWRRLLEFYVQENNHLKTRLSEIVDQLEDNLLLVEAEQFNNDFLLKDEYAADMLKDVTTQSGLLIHCLHRSGDIEPQIQKKQDRLRNEMSHIEREFIQLKNSFNHFLLTLAH